MYCKAIMITEHDYKYEKRKCKQAMCLCHLYVVNLCYPVVTAIVRIATD